VSASGISYTRAGTPTVLLVHGAFADASIWADVTPALLAAGIDVLAPPPRCAGSARMPPTSPVWPMRWAPRCSSSARTTAAR
jgi:pimeloyl-ACP methyl ester carboxylesterase